MQNLPFIIVDRFYLPGLLPLAIIAALVVARFPIKLTVILLAIFVIMGSVLFAQAAVSVIRPPQDVQPPVAEQQPPKPLSPALERMINETRQEVKTTPTSEHNIDRRIDVLRLWIGVLINQGYPVKQVFPSEDFRLIENLMKQGNIAQTSRLIDQAYGKLEEMVTE